MFPIFLAHEALKRCETTDSEHNKVAALTAGQRNLFQAFGLIQLRFQFLSLE